MINFKSLTIIIFISFFNYSVLSDESDKVSTTSSDFETSNVEDEIYDPLEPFNRAIFKFNNVADKIILEPVAKGYRNLPSPVQSGISNFLSNLRMPLVIVNQLLQGQGVIAVGSTGRFLVNTTVSDSAWKDLNRLAATGYESVSRLASGDVIMHKDICLTNRKHICLWLDKLVDEINYLKDILEKDTNSSTELIEYFSNAKKERDKWLSNFNQKDGNNKIIKDSTQVGMVQYLLGSIILKNIKRLFKRSSD